jgi:ribulose-5-phosphate 4-epimerase/fuculose-1-phosphate aldolase
MLTRVPPPAAPSRSALRRRRRDIVAIARALRTHELCVGTLGSASGRIGATAHITPTRTDCATMRARDLVTVDVASGVTLGTGTPSRELALHLAVYRARPDVGSVLHTHSVAATAWGVLGAPLRPELEDLAYHGIGSVRTCPPGRAGTDDLARGAVARLGGSRAVLLGGHGVLTVGATPQDALLAARLVERQARVAWLVRGAAPSTVETAPASVATAPRETASRT